MSVACCGVRRFLGLLRSHADKNSPRQLSPAPANPLIHSATQSGRGEDIALVLPFRYHRWSLPRLGEDGLGVRKMILAGSSASAGVALNYLTNAHMAQRLADMKPIYDGFLPTSANGFIPVLDVPAILVPHHA